MSGSTILLLYGGCLGFGCLTVFLGRGLRHIPHSLHVWQPEKSPHSATCFLGNHHTSCRMVRTPKSEGLCVHQNTVWLCVSKAENKTRTNFFPILKLLLVRQLVFAKHQVPDFVCYIARHWVLSYSAVIPAFQWADVRKEMEWEGPCCFLIMACVFPV